MFKGPNMGFPQDNGADGSAGVTTLRVSRFSSRSDLFPRLVLMQKSINARHFAVLRVGGSGTPNKRKLICELENFGPNNTVITKQLFDAYGEQMLQHIETSLLPLMWNGRDDASTAEAPEFAPLSVRLKGRVLPFSGMALPVRLGAVGNGFVVFTAPYLDLAGDTILELHGKACQVMTDLLSLDDRRQNTSEALSEREIACLQLAGDGRISEEIAENLGLSVHTVNAYLGSATDKLDAVNRIQAIAKAIRLGFIS